MANRPLILTTSKNQRVAMDFPRSKARRRLNFDEPVDRTSGLLQNIAREYKDHTQLMKEETERMAAKWNFDFKNDKPLHGDIEWHQENEGWFGRRLVPDVRQNKLMLNDKDAFIARRKKVSRQLFPEPVDTSKPLAELQNSQNQAMEIWTKECQRKWNFDFKNEEPLDGPIRWKWCSSSMTWIGALPTDKCSGILSQKITEIENGNHTILEKVIEDAEDEETMQVEEQKDGKEKEILVEELKDMQETDQEEIEMTNEHDDESIEKLLSIEEQNQVTPRNVKDDSAPVVRKRKRDAEIINEPGAKRRISFL